MASGQELSIGERSSVAPAQPERVYLVYMLVLLALVNVSSYMDRSVLAALAPQIKTDLGISDTLWGAVAGIAFAIPYAIATVPLASLADRWSRRGVLTGAVVMWSGMTALCGAAASTWHLVIGRMGVGLGEAGCLPQAQGIIAGYYPPRKRSGAMAVNSAGITIGVMLGFVLGGWIGQEHGWRTAFLALGLPGLALAALLAFTLRDPPKATPGDQQASPVGPQTLLELVRGRPSYFHLVMVFGAGAFFAAGMFSWLPSFYVREYGLTVAQAGVRFGLTSGLAAIVGVLLGGWIGNLLQPGGPLRLIKYCVVVDLVSMALNILVLLSPTATWALCFNFLAAMTGVMAHGALFSLVQTIAPEHMRSRAASLLVMMSAVIGMSGGPLLVGYLSDQFAPWAGESSLKFGLLVSTAFCLWPVLHFVLAARTIGADAAEGQE